MAKILIDGTQCSIKEESDTEFLRLLDKELSFKVQGAEHTRAFKGYYSHGEYVKWDGIHRILTRRLTFPYGLLDRVVSFYQKHGRPVHVEDRRDPHSPVSTIEIHKRLIEIDRDPYPYQWDTLDVVKDNDCGIIRIATGGGKTLVAAMMASHFGKRCIIYVIGKDLLHQIHGFFSKIFDQKIGIIGDGLCEIHDINVASVWTVGQALGLEKSKILLDTADSENKVDKSKYRSILDIMRTAKVHIFDECHLAACDTIQEISRKINPEYVYGMSASPWRDDGADLLIEGIFGSTIVDISASYLIRGGFLVKPYIKFIEVPQLGISLPRKYPTVYKHYIIDNDVRNEKIITGAERMVEQGFKPLILYTRLNHGKKLFKDVSKKFPAMLLSGKDSQETREQAKERLESGEIQGIVASTIFDIGVDLPALSGLIIAGGGKSSVRACQRIGRVIRKHPGKACAAVLDFYDQAPYFLKQHSIVRYKIYSSEEEFDVTWPE